MFGGSVGLNLADVATLTFAASYAQGGAGISHAYVNTIWGAPNTGCSDRTDDSGDLCESWGMAAGLGFGINETTSFNVFGSYEEDLSSWTPASAFNVYDSAWTVGANIIWQPVKQMKMGW